MKHIAIFCSANELEPRYTEPAEAFARLMAKNGYHLVWGGSDKGLMKAVATAVQEGGGRLIGVSIPVFEKVARINVDEMIIAKTLGERKETMLERSDAIVMLVGGIGTLDETMAMIELRKQKKHDKPIVILNTENFYEGLKAQLHKMKDDGFIPQPLDELVHFSNTPQEAFDFIHNKLRI